MKKMLLMLALGLMGISSANAQIAYEKAKLLDNTYIGAEFGTTFPQTFNHMFPLNPTLGVKLGKDFSPIFGANAEGLFSFGENGLENSHTSVKYATAGLNGTINLTNLFLDYNPDRVFNAGIEAGLAYMRLFGDPNLMQTPNVGDDSELYSKTALTFGWNLGAKKALQFYVEPAILWNLTHGPGDAVRFDRRFAQLGLFVGLNYRFKTSNGTHNFKVYNIGDLNDQINDLRNQLAQKPKEVIKETIVHDTVQIAGTNTEVRIKDLVFVTFQQGKSTLTSQMKKALNEVATGRHVEIVGTASPEGPKELNDRLSQARADVVAKYLKARGVVIDSATGEGVQGVTSNRLAVVYVK